MRRLINANAGMFLLMLIVYLITAVWYGGGASRRLSEVEDWIIENKDVPGCARRNERWIEENRGMPLHVERLKTYMEIFIAKIDDLTSEVRRLNNKLEGGRRNNSLCPGGSGPPPRWHI